MWDIPMSDALSISALAPIVYVAYLKLYDLWLDANLDSYLNILRLYRKDRIEIWAAHYAGQLTEEQADAANWVSFNSEQMFSNAILKDE